MWHHQGFMTCKCDRSRVNDVDGNTQSHLHEEQDQKNSHLSDQKRVSGVADLRK